MFKQQLKCTCDKCGKEFILEVPFMYFSLKDLFDKELTLDDLNKLYNSIECPNCKNKLKGYYPLKYLDEETGTVIAFCPDKEDIIDSIKFVEGLREDYKEFKFDLRITESLLDFIEKIKIIEKNYSDLGMELYKTLIYMDNEGFNKRLLGVNYVIEDDKEFIRFTKYDNTVEDYPLDKSIFLKHDKYARSLPISKRNDNYIVNMDLAMKIMKNENQEPLHYEMFKEVFTNPLKTKEEK